MNQKPSRELTIRYGEMCHAMEYLLEGKHHLSIHDARPVEVLASIDVAQKFREYLLQVQR